MKRVQWNIERLKNKPRKGGNWKSPSEPEIENPKDLVILSVNHNNFHIIESDTEKCYVLGN